MSEIAIPVEFLLTTIAGILAATFGILLKQSRCIGRLEAWAKAHDRVSAEKIGMLDKLRQEWDQHKKAGV